MIIHGMGQKSLKEYGLNMAQTNTAIGKAF